MDMVDGKTNTWYTNRCRHKVAELMYYSMIESDLHIWEYSVVKEYWSMVSSLVIVALNEHFVKHYIDVKLTSLPEVTADLFNMLTKYHRAMHCAISIPDID